MLVIRILFPEIYCKIRFMFTESHFEKVSRGKNIVKREREMYSKRRKIPTDNFTFQSVFFRIIYPALF